MNPGIIVGIIIGIILLILICWFISTSNKLIRLNEKVDESFSGIDVALTQRFDLLSKMFNVANSYLKYEKETLSDIVKLRNPNTCYTIEEYNECSKQLENAQKQLNVVVEQYPDLKGNTTMIQLQDACKEVEENLAAARRLYNSNVTSYNQSILVFPNSIVANMKHLSKKEFFKAEESKRADVSFDFNF